MRITLIRLVQKEVNRMRMGLNIEYEGKNYDILELPMEAFVQLVPGMTNDQFYYIDSRFFDFWPEPTQRRNHVLAFAAQLLGASIDFLLLNHESMQFDDEDIQQYINKHTKKGIRPS